MAEFTTKWENEDWNVRHPDDNIKCKKCAFRLPDVTTKDSVLKRHTFGICEVFKAGSGKPREVLWDGADCPYFVEGDPE